MLSDDILQIIKKQVEGKDAMKLTVGVLSQDSTDIQVFDGHGALIDDEGFRYEIGSITKTFSTTLMAKYCVENKLALDESFSTYIADLPSGQYYPTMRQLATHTSGYGLVPFNRLLSKTKLFYGIYVSGTLRDKNPFIAIDEKEMRALIKKNPVKTENRYVYSNFGMGILATVIGEVDGLGYRIAMEQFVRDELQLAETDFGNERLLSGYMKPARACGNWNWNDASIILGAGGLRSSARDLLKYAALNLKAEQEYFSFGQERQGVATKGNDMALGWHIRNVDDTYWHTGGTGSFTSILAFSHEKNIAVVVLSNYLLPGIKNIAFGIMDEHN